MADRHEAFQVTCAANTARANATEIATTFPAGEVAHITVHVPSGHASLTGFQIAVAHQAVIPPAAGQFIVTNFTTRTFTPARMPNSGQWSIIAYNTDNRDHYWQFVFDVDEIRGVHHGYPYRTQPIARDLIHGAAGERRLG